MRSPTTITRPPARPAPVRVRGARALFALLTVPAVLLMAGCTDMYDGSRIKPLEESRFFPDRRASRTLVEGTVPRGMARTDEHFYEGKIGGRPAETFPIAVTDSVLARGRDRFNTFCSPCHSRLGDGNGMIVQRGFPKPNSFHTDSVRNKPVGYYFDVITNGFGRMYSYAHSVPVEDRWAIVAYLRALQYSTAVDAGLLTPEERSRLDAPAGGRKTREESH